jgi:hypothetical protein
VKARLLAGGEVTAEAEGVFVSLGDDAFIQMFDSAVARKV